MICGLSLLVEASPGGSGEGAERRCAAGLELSAERLSLSAEGSVPVLKLSRARLSPCPTLSALLRIESESLEYRQRELKLKRPTIIVGSLLRAPLPSLSLDSESPWSWLRLPRLSWAQGELSASAPLSVPLGSSLSLTTWLGWWGGPQAGAQLSSPEGSLEYEWTRAHGWALKGGYAHSSASRGGLNVWLLGVRSSAPLMSRALSAQGWGARVIMGRDELWAGLSAQLTEGLELRLTSAQWSAPSSPDLSVAQAQLTWASLGEAGALSALRLSGVILGTTEADVMDLNAPLRASAGLSARLERARWFGALRLRGRAQAQGALQGGAVEGGAGWTWLSLGLGTLGTSAPRAPLSSLELELRVELIQPWEGLKPEGAPSASPLQGAELSLAPRWAQLAGVAPALLRSGLSVEQLLLSSLRGSQLRLKGWVGVAALEEERSSPQALALMSLGLSSAARPLPWRLELELGSSAQERWGAGEARLGDERYISARWVGGAGGPLGAWGLTRLSALSEPTWAQAPQRLALELGQERGQLKGVVTLWSGRVVEASARWSSLCSCWGLRSTATWAEGYGAGLSFSLYLGRGG